MKTYQRIRTFMHTYERWFMPTMLVCGTAFDVWQFHILDLREKFIVMLIYALVVMASLLLMVSPKAESNPRLRYLRIAAPLFQQFAMGGLLSTSLLFYWFSGAISVTWPLVAIVAILMITNEVLRDIVLKPVVQVGVFAFVTFSLFVTYFANVFSSLSLPVFLAGGLASMVLMTGFLVMLVRVGDLYDERIKMWLTVAGVFAFMNVCYVLNVIPPIPLSLRDAGMYYDIEKVNGEYVLTGETENWWQSLVPGEIVTLAPGSPLYAYTAVYAPTGVSTAIVHVWQQWNTSTEEWDTIGSPAFTITGGRPDGYRGYTMLSSCAPGKWRISVETASGQVLGRIGFRIEAPSE